MSAGVVKAIMAANPATFPAVTGDGNLVRFLQPLLCVCNDVQPDPKLENVESGLQILHNNQAEVVVAIGGGSSLDCAKAICCLARNPGPLSNYAGYHKIPNPGLPLIAVPTTAGTGSEATKVTVITDTKNNVKMMILDDHLLPTVAIVDYELTFTMPASLTAAVGVDTLTYAIEAYVSKRASALTDPIAADLPPDERQLLELLKAISSRPKVLVLDETTASLGTKQVDRLFGLIKQWKQDGVGIVFVSHRMHELFEIADDMTVLRNGSVALEARTTDVKVEDLVTAMVGDDVRMAAIAATREHEVHPTSSKIVLDARIEKSSKIKRVHLALKEGEILGLGGLQGQGQDEVLRCLFGAARFTGRIEVFGQECHFRHSADAVQAGIALVPGDRNRQGGIALHSIFENLLLPSLDRFQIAGVLRLKQAAEQVSKIIRQLRVKTSSFRETVSTLSGGNAQKLVIGKWLLRGPRILLLDDPTKGVNVMTKAEIYRLLTELRGKA
jgi:ABC-type branched-subunit amino acid transport system ATPase component